MTVKVTGLNNFTARLRTAARHMQTGADDVVTDAAEYGAELMREYIATRGTPSTGKEGRIESGHMYESVTISPIRHNASGVAVNFGWVFETEDYFRYQEEGTRTVPRMHALLDATIKTREYFYDEVRGLVKRL